MVTINNRNLCENCFSEIISEPCPHCGYMAGSGRQDPIALPSGSVLSGRYRIGGVVGKGGFGITYIAYDLKLDARIAVKEYYPLGLAIRVPGNTMVSVASKEAGTSFSDGAGKFYNEAKMVAKFNDNPNIVSVHDFFYENDTVYYVMGYMKGQTLKSYIKNQKITEGQAVSLLNNIANALTAPHAMNVLHRDISPDNIMLCEDGTIRLLDFGAARQVMAEQSNSLSVILKQGYAPLEQYQRKGKQGPWTDIYALGATAFTALTGDILDDPMSRLEDDSSFEAKGPEISPLLWNIIKKCVQLKINDRYQNISELKEDLDNAGIERETFTGIKEEISDFLKGELPEGSMLDTSGMPGQGTSDSTMLLGASGGHGLTEELHPLRDQQEDRVVPEEEPQPVEIQAENAEDEKPRKAAPGRQERRVNKSKPERKPININEFKEKAQIVLLVTACIVLLVLFILGVRSVISYRRGKIVKYVPESSLQVSACEDTLDLITV